MKSTQKEDYILPCLIGICEWESTCDSLLWYIKNDLMEGSRDVSLSATSILFEFLRIQNQHHA